MGGLVRWVGWRQVEASSREVFSKLIRSRDLIESPTMRIPFEQ